MLLRNKLDPLIVRGELQTDLLANLQADMKLIFRKIRVL